MADSDIAASRVRVVRVGEMFMVWPPVFRKIIGLNVLYGFSVPSILLISAISAFNASFSAFNPFTASISTAVRLA